MYKVKAYRVQWFQFVWLANLDQFCGVKLLTVRATKKKKKCSWSENNPKKIIGGLNVDLVYLDMIRN